MYTAFHQSEEQSSEQPAQLCVVLAGSEAEVASLFESLTSEGVLVLPYEARSQTEERERVPLLLWQGKVDAIWFATPEAVKGFARRLKHDGGTLAMLDNVEVVAANEEGAQAAHELGLSVSAIASDAVQIIEAARAHLIFA